MKRGSIEVSYNYDPSKPGFVATYIVQPVGKAFSTRDEAVNFLQGYYDDRRIDIRDLTQTTSVINPLSGEEVLPSNRRKRKVRVKVWSGSEWKTRSLGIGEDVRLSPLLSLDFVRDEWMALGYSGSLGAAVCHSVYGTDDLRLVGNLASWKLEDLEGKRRLSPFVYVDVPESGPIRVGASMGVGWTGEDFCLVQREEVGIATSLAVSLAGALNRWHDLGEFWQRWNDELDIMWDFE